MGEHAPVEVFPLAHVGVHFGYVAGPRGAGEDEVLGACACACAGGGAGRLEGREAGAFGRVGDVEGAGAGADGVGAVLGFDVVGVAGTGLEGEGCG